MYSVIVVGTDGSATATSAVHQAIELAAMCNATLHVVSAYRPLTTTVGGVWWTEIPVEHWAVHPRDEVESILEEAAADARIKGVKVETHAKRTEPASAVLSVCKAVKADAVVVGNKGMKGAKRFLLGSIPNKIAHDAPCSVIIAKTV